MRLTVRSARPVSRVNSTSIAERDVSRGNRLGTDQTEGHDRHLIRPA